MHVGGHARDNRWGKRAREGRDLISSQVERQLDPALSSGK